MKSPAVQEADLGGASAPTITLAPHPSAAQIDERYRACAEMAEKTSWHPLWLLTHDGAEAATEVALATSDNS